jgi:NADPH:quinone reductase
LGITGGRGVDVVYDAVGKDTFEGSLRSLKPRGTLVSFGQASGDVGAYEIGKLAGKSVTLSRPNYMHFTDSADANRSHAERFFSVLRSKSVAVDHPRVFPLADTSGAHALIESRSQIGSIVLSAN